MSSLVALNAQTMRDVQSLEGTNNNNLPVDALPFVGEPLEGVGIHTGKKFRVRLVASRHSDFLRFKALRHNDNLLFDAPALWSRLSGTARATALVLRSEKPNQSLKRSTPSSATSASTRVEIKTIEHFLAAYHVMGLRGYDLLVEALEPLKENEAFELPILEGAGLRWVQWLEKCLASDSNRPSTILRPAWKVIHSLEIQDGNKKVILLPHENPELCTTRLNCSVDFYSKWAQKMSCELNWLQVATSVEAFKQNIAPARTFGFEHELEELAKKGLAMGGSLENALLLNHERVINEGGFCVPEELAAHKLLDAIGDFALLGAPLIGVIDLHYAGHSMHLRAVTEAIRKGALLLGTLDSHGRFQRSAE